MKLQQLHEDNAAIHEGAIQRAIAAAAMVIGSLSPNAPTDTTPTDVQTRSVSGKFTNAPGVLDQIGNQTGAKASRLAPDVINIIAQRYKVDPNMVKEIVVSVKKHEKDVFPKAHHLLGLIGVESGFNPNAKSALKTDPALGLTQIRPGSWGIQPTDLKTIDAQIAKSAEILAQYYRRLGNDADAALHAYNVGIGNHRKSAKDPSKGNPRYVPKIHAETNRYVNKASDAEARPTPTR